MSTLSMPTAATSAPVRQVLVGPDGYVLGTPPDWKTALRSPRVADDIVWRYLRVCHLGTVIVNLGNFRPHDLQRPLHPDHAAVIAEQLLAGNNQSRRFPLCVVADTEPVFKTAYDQSPFLNPDGKTTQVVTLFGNHRVAALDLYVNTYGHDDPGWLSDVYHPCFLNIHADHIQRLILTDNIASDDDMLRRPGSLRLTFLYALDIVLDAWSGRAGVGPPAFHLIPLKAPRLALFKGGLTNTPKLYWWKLALRIFMRDYRIVKRLRTLFKMPGSLQSIQDKELCTFLWNLASHGIGCESILYVLLSKLVAWQDELNRIYKPQYDQGFDIHALWDSIFIRNHIESGNLTYEGPTREQVRHFDQGIHQGAWDNLFESCHEFYLAFRCNQFTDAQGANFSPEALPTLHVACVASRHHKHEGYLITELSRVKVCVRILCLVLFGPVGILQYTDINPSRLLVLPVDVCTLIPHLVSHNLLLWLKQRTDRYPQVGTKYPTEHHCHEHALELIDDVMERFADDPTAWCLPPDFYEALSAVTGGALGTDARPARDAKIPQEMYPAVARVVNRVLGNRHWHWLLFQRWQLQPGLPFAWEPSVDVSSDSLESAEITAIHRKGQQEIHQRRLKARDAQDKLEDALQEARQNAEQLQEQRDQTEVAQKDLLEAQLQKLDKSRDRAQRKLDKRRTELENEAHIVVADLSHSVEAATKRARQLQERLDEQVDILNRLPDTIDPLGLTADELVALLGRHGISVSRNPFQVKPDLSTFKFVLPVELPPAPPASQDSDDSEDDLDFETALRDLFAEAVICVPESTRNKMARLAARVPRTHVEQLFTSAILSGLAPPLSSQVPVGWPDQKSPSQADGDAADGNAAVGSDSASDTGSRRLRNSPHKGRGKRARIERSPSSPPPARGSSRRVTDTAGGPRAARKRRSGGGSTTSSSENPSHSSDEEPFGETVPTPPASDDEDMQSLYPRRVSLPRVVPRGSPTGQVLVPSSSAAAPAAARPSTPAVRSTSLPETPRSRPLVPTQLNSRSRDVHATPRPRRLANPSGVSSSPNGLAEKGGADLFRGSLGGGSGNLFCTMSSPVS
ncbi:hypothetical protein K438DRAFT_1975936 [Mycena galopus ATCC 62051]|nr:hypothetical protein K438DRAFT_1975936 [Mycena galopus ATCC 62051]